MPQLYILCLYLTAAAAQSTPPILEPADFTTWVATSIDGLSRKAFIDVPFTNSSGAEDHVLMTRLDLVGNAEQRGYAQGELMAEEIWELYNVALPEYFISQVVDLTDDEDARDSTTAARGAALLARANGALPRWLRALLEAAAAEAIPAVFFRAMDWVWAQEAAYTPPRLVAEMVAMGEGVCAGLNNAAATPPHSKAKAQPEAPPRPPCNATEWAANLQRLNMLPELIKMTCTMFGAWGDASASGHLLQLRALDFGASPLANYTLLAVHRPLPVAEKALAPTASVAARARSVGVGAADGALWQAFATVGFPGLVGVVTGVAERGVGLSEKVWEISNGTDGSVQPGAYDGEADVLVMRDVLELAANRSAANDYLRDPTAHGNRTWAVFLGVGDYDTQQMDIVGYRASDFHAYTPETMPAVTGQPYMEDLVYVDKHPQPSHDATSLPDLLAAAYGQLDVANTAAVAAAHETGDLHIAIYDYTPARPMLWFALGRIDDKGDFGPDGTAWKACYRPYLAYSMSDLWEGK